MSGGTFEALSGYTGVGSGNVEFKVTVPGNTGTLIDTIYGLSGSTDFTYVTTGTAGAASGVLIADEFGSVGSQVAFRVLNMSTINPSVDVYLTQPGADLTAATPIVAAAVIATVTAFANTSGGNLELRMTPAGTKDVIYDATVSLRSRHGTDRRRLRPRQQQARQRGNPRVGRDRGDREQPAGAVQGGERDGRRRAAQRAG